MIAKLDDDNTRCGCPLFFRHPKETAQAHDGNNLSPHIDESPSNGLITLRSAALRQGGQRNHINNLGNHVNLDPISPITKGKGDKMLDFAHDGARSNWVVMFFAISSRGRILVCALS